MELVVLTSPCEMDYLDSKFCVLRITNSWDIKSYLTKFLVFLMFTYLTFYKVLSTLTNSPNATFDIFGSYYSNGILRLCDKNISSVDYSSPYFDPCLEYHCFRG